MNEPLMWDPPGRAGGILTERELAWCLHVLRALSAHAFHASICASVTLTWGEDETRAYLALARVGYVGDPDERPAPRKATAPFRWARVAATEAGLCWLGQCERPVTPAP